MSPGTQTGKENGSDPRVARSRRMLMDALANLLKEKEFDDISIQEIAEKATLNRATFYLHFPSKIALLQVMTAARFSDLITRRGLAFTDCDQALRAICLGVCDYLTETRCPDQLAKMPMEGSVVEVVRNMFLEGAKESAGGRSGARDEAWASAVAWAIFGAARQWFLTPDHMPAEQMAEKIQTMVKPLLLY